MGRGVEVVGRGRGREMEKERVRREVWKGGSVERGRDRDREGRRQTERGIEQ
jgi:hypothetical protein